MEDDIILSAIVDLETQQVAKKFADFYTETVKGLDEIHRASGKALDVKKLQSDFESAAKIAKNLGSAFPKLDDASLKTTLQYLDKVNKSLSAPVGNTMDKYLTKMVSESRDFGNAFKGVSSTLEKVIQQLETAERLQAKLGNNLSFSSYPKRSYTGTELKSTAVNDALKKLLNEVPDRSDFQSVEDFRKATEAWQRTQKNLQEQYKKIPANTKTGSLSLGSFGAFGKESYGFSQDLIDESKQIEKAIAEATKRLEATKQRIAQGPSPAQVKADQTEQARLKAYQDDIDQSAAAKAREARYKQLRDQIKNEKASAKAEEDAEHQANLEEARYIKTRGRHERQSKKAFMGIYKDFTNADFREEGYQRRMDKNRRQLTGFLPFGAVEPDAHGSFEEFERQAKELENMLSKPERLKELQGTIKGEKAKLAEEQTTRLHETLRKLNSTPKEDKEYSQILNDTIKNLESFLSTNKEFLNPAKIRQIEKTVDSLIKKQSSLELKGSGEGGPAAETISRERQRGLSALQEIKNSTLKKDPLDTQLELREIALEQAKKANAIYALDQQEIAKLEGEIAVLKKKIKDGLIKQKNADEKLIKETDTELISNALFDIKQRVKKKKMSPEQAAADLNDLYKSAENYTIPKSLKNRLLTQADAYTEGTVASNKRKELEKLKDQAADLNNQYKSKKIDEAGHIRGIDNILQNKNIPDPARRTLEARRAALEGKLNTPDSQPKPKKPSGGGGDGFNIQDAFNFLAFSQLSSASKRLTESMIDAAASLEQYKRRIDIVLKNPGKSDKYFDFLLEYEKRTPYDLPEVMNAGTAFAAQEKTLKRVGETKESAVTLAGELASINPTAGITEAQRALSRVIAGDSNGLEILRSQFNVTNETLAEGGVKLGSSGVPLQTLAQKQRVVDAINKYVQDLTGGIGAIGQSTTLQGKLSTLGSQVNKTMAKIMEPLIPALSKLTDSLTKFLELIEKAPEPIRKGMGTLAIAMSGLVSAATAASLVSWGGKALGLGGALSGGAKVAATAAGEAATGVEAGVTQAAVSGLLPKLIGIFKFIFKNTFGALWKGLGAALSVGLGGAVAAANAQTMAQAIRFLIFDTIKAGLARLGVALGTAAAGTVALGTAAIAGVGLLGYKTYQGIKGVEDNHELLRKQGVFNNEMKWQNTRRTADTGLSDEQFVENMTFNDPRLDSKEKNKENIARLDEMIAQKRKHIKEAEKLWTSESDKSKELNKQLANLIDLRSKQNGFIKIDLEQMAEDEKRLNNEVAIGRATVSDQAALARKQFTDLDQEIKQEQKPEDAYLTKEEQKELKELNKKKAQMLKDSGGVAKMGVSQKEDYQTTIDRIDELKELGTNNRSADMRKLLDARSAAEIKAANLEKQAFQDRENARIDNATGAKEATGRLTARDRINAAIAKKGLIDGSKANASELIAAADNSIASARRDQFLAENKRRIESVRQLRGEEKARLREITMEEKQALAAQTGYAEDYDTRIKAFKTEQTALEKKLSGINKATKRDEYYKTLELLSKSKVAEQKFVEAYKGNEQQVRIIRETARRERLAIVQQTLAEIRAMEQKNIEAIADMEKAINDTRANANRSKLETEQANKQSNISILDNESTVLDPKTRFTQQMQILKMTRDLYNKEGRKLLNQSLEDTIRDAKNQTAKIKREIQNNIFSIKMEMDKLGPGNSPEKNKRREELRKSLYIEQNRLVKEPARIQLEAQTTNARLQSDYRRQGRELDSNEKLKKQEEQRTRASETIERQIQAFQQAKAELEYKANLEPENQSRFDKVKNLEDQFQAEKTILDLKKKAATDKDLNPNMSGAERDLIEKSHKLEILDLQKKYLEVYKEITAEIDKQAETERKARLEAIQAKLGEQQKNQGLEGFSMGGSYSLEEMQEREKLESEAFRLKAGFGLSKKKGADHGDNMRKQGQDHGNKGATFSGMFGNLKDDYLKNNSNILKDTFNYADMQKQGFEFKNGQIMDKNPGNWIPKMEAYVIVDLQNNGKSIKKIEKPLKSSSNFSPHNTNVSQDGK